MKRFSYRLDDLELRSCTDNLLQDGDHTTAEIVKWEDKNCFTIAVFDINDTPDLRFIGKRPLAENIHKFNFFKLVEEGYNLLYRMIDFD